MVCSQALRPSLQSDQKRYSVGDGSLILRYSGGVAGTQPGPTWVPVVSEERWLTNGAPHVLILPKNPEGVR